MCGWLVPGYSCGALATVPYTTWDSKWHREYISWGGRHDKRTVAGLDIFWWSSSSNGWNHVSETGRSLSFKPFLCFDKGLPQLLITLLAILGMCQFLLCFGFNLVNVGNYYVIHIMVQWYRGLAAQFLGSGIYH